MSGDTRVPVTGITIPYRVRFDECGPDGLARSSTLLRYAQDVAWVHSERMGFDRDWYRRRELTWVVRSAELGYRRPLGLGETLDVSTAVTGFRRVWARRRTEGRLSDGTLVFWGHTDWVMLDDRGMPTRVPPEFPAAFVEPPGTFEPGRVPLPPSPPHAATCRISVRPQDLDPMGHVNNATYLDYLEEALLAAGGAAAAATTATPRTVRLEYVAPAAPAASLVGTTWPDSADGRSSWAWRLTDERGAELARGRALPGG
jgi:acyl-CoA thioesterase FadM